jgi:hypothetical protein
MNAEEVFNALTVDGKIQLLEKADLEISPEEIRREVAEWMLADMEPRFSDLLYDVQDAVLPALRRLA